MNDQQKQAIQSLLQAVDVACTRGAFNLNEAGQIATYAQIANSLLQTPPEPAKTIAAPETEKAD